MSIILIPECVRAQSTSDGVTLNIKLHPVQTIAVNASQKNADLQYITREDYENGISATFDDHLTVTSTGGFQVNVVAGTDNFKLSGAADLILVSDVVVSATNGSGNLISNNYNSVALSTKTESLIRSQAGGKDLKFNVTYDNSSGSSGKYVGMDTGHKNSEAVYSTEITYTIISK